MMAAPQSPLQKRTPALGNAISTWSSDKECSLTEAKPSEKEERKTTAFKIGDVRIPDGKEYEATVNKIIAKYAKTLKDCWKGSNASGCIEFKITIGADGSVKSIEPVKNEIGKAAEACFTVKMSLWDFKALQNPEKLTVFITFRIL